MEEKIIYVAGIRLVMYECGYVNWGSIPCQLWCELMPSNTIKSSCRPTWDLNMDDIYRDEDALGDFLRILSSKIGHQVCRLNNASILGERGISLENKGMDFSGYKTIYIYYK